MPSEKEGYLVSKNFDRFFMAYLLIGGIVLFGVLPLYLFFTQ